MLSTVALDAYRVDQAQELAQAIDDICPPEGGGPFGPAGLYGFWDPESKHLFYIGLARDLGIRFRQHNGLVACAPKNCKCEQISAWFGSHQLIGYSIVLMSPLDQSSTLRAKGPYRHDVDARMTLEEHGALTSDEVRMAEGQLLQAYVDQHGELPPWNRIGGSQSGRARVTSNVTPMLDIIRARYVHALTARRQVRELAADPCASRWENLLHVARYEMLIRHGAGGEDLLRRQVEEMAARPDWTGAGGFRELLASGYLDGRGARR